MSTSVEQLLRRLQEENRQAREEQSGKLSRLCLSLIQSDDEEFRNVVRELTQLAGADDPALDEDGPHQAMAGGDGGSVAGG